MVSSNRPFLPQIHDNTIQWILIILPLDMIYFTFQEYFWFLFHCRKKIWEKKNYGYFERDLRPSGEDLTKSYSFFYGLQIFMINKNVTKSHWKKYDFLLNGEKYELCVMCKGEHLVYERTSAIARSLTSAKSNGNFSIQADKLHTIHSVYFR